MRRLELDAGEIDALLEAAAFRLAGEIQERTEEQIEALESAAAKLGRAAE